MKEIENKERKEREELLAKIKKSIEDNKEKYETNDIKNVNLIKKEENIQKNLDREEIVEKSRNHIDIDKIKKSKSLYELFEDEAVGTNKSRKKLKKSIIKRNIDLGNVYSKTSR